ncbi:MAG: nucleotidyltransferase domain-containing protein [Elusimicrobiota bacterium]|jgi:predicted nucleotidyltransferase
MKEKLEPVAAALREALKEDLAALVLYGSAARGKHAEGSDVNLLVVLKDSALDAVERAARVLAGEKTLKLRPVFMTEEELARSGDVFPLEYRDILAGYDVLHGADPLKGLRVDTGNLRHQLEFELRSKLMRLRSEWPALRSDPKALKAALAAAGPSFARLCAEAAVLGVRVPPERSAPFEECRSLRGPEKGCDLPSLYRRVHDAAAELVRAVDLI